MLRAGAAAVLAVRPCAIGTHICRAGRFRSRVWVLSPRWLCRWGSSRLRDWGSSRLRNWCSLARGRTARLQLVRRMLRAQPTTDSHWDCWTKKGPRKWPAAKGRVPNTKCAFDHSADGVDPAELPRLNHFFGLAEYRSYWSRKSSITRAASSGPSIQTLTQPVLGST